MIRKRKITSCEICMHCTWKVFTYMYKCTTAHTTHVKNWQRLTEGKTKKLSTYITPRYANFFLKYHGMKYFFWKWKLSLNLMKRKLNSALNSEVVSLLKNVEHFLVWLFSNLSKPELALKNAFVLKILKEKYIFLNLTNIKILLILSMELFKVAFNNK